MGPDPSLTDQLRQFSDGDKQIAEAVMQAVLPKLHEIALRHVRRERQVAPVTATELINEVWLRHLRNGGFEIRNRQHFYAIAAHAMRQVLVDFARARLALSRGGGQAPVSLDGLEAPVPAPEDGLTRVVEIGKLLDVLAMRDPAGARIVELHYFAGFTLEEISEITGLSLRRVRYRWGKAIGWLKSRFESQ